MCSTLIAVLTASNAQPHSFEMCEVVVQHDCCSNGVCVDSFKYHSEENVSVAVSESSPPVSTGAHCSPQFGPLAPQYNPQYLLPHAAPATDELRAPRNDDNMTSILKQLEQGREMQLELQEAIADIQVFTLHVCIWLFCACH